MFIKLKFPGDTSRVFIVCTGSHSLLSDSCITNRISGFRQSKRDDADRAKRNVWYRRNRIHSKRPGHNQQVDNSGAE